MNFTINPWFVLFYLDDNVKTELIVPHIDFHKLPHKISAEGRQHQTMSSANKHTDMAVVTSELSKMAAMNKLCELTKPHPLMALTPGIIAQMYALNNMLPALQGFNSHPTSSGKSLLLKLIL